MKTLLFVFIASFGLSSYAGVINGGGDKGVVCRNLDGSIASAETLDLFEAKNLYGLVPWQFIGTVDGVLDSMRTRLQSTMDQPEIHLFPLMNRVRNILRLVPPTVILKPVDDAAEVALPTGCTLEQLANYVDDDLLLVSQEIWDHLSLADKAALHLHEAIYRLERSQGAQNSRRTRKIVGHLLSGFPFVQVKTDLAQDAKICSAVDGDRVLYQFAYSSSPAMPKNQTKLQFFVFEGRSVYSKKTAILPIELPWLAQLNYFDCTYSDSCNIAGGDATSNFENSGFVTLGVERTVRPDMVQLKFYFLSPNGKSYLQCNPQ